jgi:hypothetical protein
MTTAIIDAEGVPVEVSRARQAIVEAALACDYDALNRIGAFGPMVTTIDGEPAPVDTWAQRERQGEAILRSVAGILSLTPADAGEDGSLTWPSAVDWHFSDVAPAGERQALVDVVGEDGVFGWEETGGYAGWRSTIGPAGNWLSLTLGPLPG